MKKICVITGTRAEYGLLKWLMRAIHDETDFQLQLVVSGSHLSEKHGFTYREIEADGFEIDRKLEMPFDLDNGVEIARSMGQAVGGFADIYQELSPDLLIVLGDRYEIYAAVSAALFMEIPVAHLHGGELSEGAYDDAIRHAVTKMSHLHFVANNIYRNRVIQLGEMPERVHTVGGLGIDTILKTEFLKQDELERQIDFKFGAKNLLITYHPETIGGDKGRQEIDIFLETLAELDGVKMIFTLPNMDKDSQYIAQAIEAFAGKHRATAKAFKSLGQQRYLSCMKYCDVVLGNSSSGLIEAPALKKATVNIGNRQAGRLKAKSVIDAEPSKHAILEALELASSQNFKEKLSSTINPYGDGGAVARIMDVLRKTNFDNLTEKHFHDL